MDALAVNKSEWLLNNIFNGPENRVSLKAGELLIDQEQPNDRLFLVISGLLIGYRRHGKDLDGNHQHEEFFRGDPGMLVGVYSFFSKIYVSSARIIAKKDSEVTFISRHDFENLGRKTYQTLLEESIFLIVNQLHRRQKLAMLSNIEGKNTLKRLAQADKMSTLGQMAAGLAHELNNAVLVIERGTSNLSENVKTFIANRCNGFTQFFIKGLSRGNQVSTKTQRENAKELEYEGRLDRPLAKKLAQTGIDWNDLKKIGKSELEEVFEYWKIGADLHDMQNASRHAIHVVKSVKQLGANKSERADGLLINDTIQEALGILASPLRRVEHQEYYGDISPIFGNGGEFVQVWINLVKNGCEALFGAQTASPEITIRTFERDECIQVVIEDNGPGIPDDIKARIFEPSFTTKVDGLSFGLGLGLPIVQKIIESYQGQILIETEPGHTKFIVSIPIKLN